MLVENGGSEREWSGCLVYFHAFIKTWGGGGWDCKGDRYEQEVYGSYEQIFEINN